MKKNYKSEFVVKKLISTSKFFHFKMMHCSVILFLIFKFFLLCKLFYYINKAVIVWGKTK